MGTHIVGTCRIGNIFHYLSQKLGQVRNFATSDYIQIMVINIDAFRKSFTDPDKEDKANIIHRPHDRMTGNRPIEFVQATNPIVIIDEPQSVDTTSKSKEAIASLNPLCTLRYSATHVDKYHMMYKLDSVDAYQRKLVKQIEVSGIEVKDSHNKAFIRLLKVDNRKSPIIAQIEIDAMQRSGDVKRVKKTIRSGDDLLELSGGRSVYDGYIIEDIYCEKGNEYISFTSKPEIIKLDQAICGFDNQSRFRPEIQVLLMALRMPWRPIDPNLLLQFLAHPVGPLPKRVRFPLAQVVAESPGLGGRPWEKALNKIFEHEETEHGAKSDEIDKLRDRVSPSMLPSCSSRGCGRL